MPQQTYFIVGDLACNLLCGLVAALLCNWIISPQWLMPVAMVVGMLVGMVVAMVLGTGILMRYFGAMEVMLPTLLSGMLAGMWVGMRAAMAPLPTMDAAVFGALLGITVVALCWVANNQLRGKQHRE